MARKRVHAGSVSRTGAGAPGTAGLAVLGILYWTAHSMLRPLVGTRVITLGGNEAQASIALAAFSLFPTLLAILIGAVTDRWGTRRLLVLGALLMVVGGALLLIPTLVAVIVSQVIIGLGTLACWVSLQTIATRPASADESRDARLGRIATFSLFVAFGQSAGPALGGLLQSFGGHALAFGCYVLLALTLGCASLSVVPRSAPQASEARRPLLRSYGDAFTLLRNPTVLVAVTASFAALAIHDIRTGWQPILFAGAGLSPWQIGIILSVGALAGFAARPFFTHLLRWLGAPLMVGLVLAVGGITSMLVVIAPGDMGFLLGVGVVNGLAVGFMQPLSLSLLSEEVAPESLGLASGMRSMGNQAALLASPAAFGTISAISSLSVAFLVVGSAAATVGLTGGLTLALLSRRGARRSQPPEPADRVVNATVAGKS